MAQGNVTHEEHLEAAAIMSQMAQGNGDGKTEVRRGWILNKLELTKVCWFAPASANPSSGGWGLGSLGLAWATSEFQNTQCC